MINDTDSNYSSSTVEKVKSNNKDKVKNSKIIKIRNKFTKQHSKLININRGLKKIRKQKEFIEKMMKK